MPTRSKTTRRSYSRGGSYGNSIRAGSAPGERSEVVVTDSQLIGSRIGLASKEDSKVDLVRTELRGNQLAVALYRDKPIFGGGFVRIRGGRLAGNDRDFDVQPGSDLQLDGVRREPPELPQALSERIAGSPTPAAALP